MNLAEEFAKDFMRDFLDIRIDDIREANEKAINLLTELGLKDKEEELTESIRDYFDSTIPSGDSTEYMVDCILQETQILIEDRIPGTIISYTTGENKTKIDIYVNKKAMEIIKPLTETKFGNDIKAQISDLWHHDIIKKLPFSVKALADFINSQEEIDDVIDFVDTLDTVLDKKYSVYSYKSVTKLGEAVLDIYKSVNEMGESFIDGNELMDAGTIRRIVKHMERFFKIYGHDHPKALKIGQYFTDIIDFKDLYIKIPKSGKVFHISNNSSALQD